MSFFAKIFQKLNFQFNLLTLSVLFLKLPKFEVQRHFVYIFSTRCKIGSITFNFYAKGTKPCLNDVVLQIPVTLKPTSDQIKSSAIKLKNLTFYGHFVEKTKIMDQSEF